MSADSFADVVLADGAAIRLRVGAEPNELAAELDGAVIARGRFAPIEAGDTAAVSVEVVAEQLHRGLGTLLLEHLAALAAEQGVHRFVVDVAADPTAAASDRGEADRLEVLRRSGWRLESEPGPAPGLVRLSWPLDAAAAAAAAERERVADAAAAAHVLAPSSIAVIGARASGEGVGALLLENICEGGFTGPVYPIHPTAAAINGRRAWPSLAALPEPVELAVVAVPAPAAARVVAECGAAGVRAAVVVTSGFAELAGSAGAAAQTELVTAARRHGLRLVGPNCFGVANTSPEVGLNATFSAATPSRGRVGMVTQSGAVGIAAIDWANRAGLGLSSFVSIGNRADLSSNDFIQYWEDDPDTDVCLLYLESLGNPAKFARIARRVAQRKPILAVKSGRSGAGRRAAQSHTASLAGDDVLAATLLGHCGVIRLDTLEQLFDAARLVAAQPLPAGRRVAILGNSGGPEIMAADACEGAGLEVARLSAELIEQLAASAPPASSLANPVDLTSGADPDQLRAATLALLRAEEIDAVLVVYTALARAEEAIQAFADALTVHRLEAERPKPLAACLLAAPGQPTTLPLGDGGSAPVYPFPESAAAPLACAAALAQWRARPVEPPTPAPAAATRAARLAAARFLARRPEGGWLAPDELAELLGAYGIALPPSEAVWLVGGSADDAAVAAAAARVGRAGGAAVAVKALGSTILHKSDVGGVLLGVAPADAAAAARGLRARLGAALEGVLVQAMAPPGVETIVGAVHDEQFGPLVMFGLGGVAAELFADRSFRLAPLSRPDAAELVRAPKSAALLFGWRNAPAVDAAALEALLEAVGWLAADVPELAELDLNPVLARPDGITVVDARARLASHAPLPALPVRRIE